MAAKELHLKGIVLTIATHSGPQYVYHYACPKSNDQEVEDTWFDDTDSDDAIDWSESDEEAPYIPIALNLPAGSLLNTSTRRRRRRAMTVKSGQDSIVVQEEDTTQIPKKLAQDAENLVFGFDSRFLAELLSPPRQLCNQRFELAVDGASFVGLPVHILPSGTWRKLKQVKKNSVASAEGINGDSDGAEEDGQKESELRDSIKDLKIENESSMVQFNVTLVLVPPTQRAKLHTDQLYQYVVSQLARMLRHEQARDNYVWEEAMKIAKIREESMHDNNIPNANVLDIRIRQSSELARALHHIFQAIASNGIARVQIGHKIRAFQLPTDHEVVRLPHFVDEATLARNQLYPGTLRIRGKEIGEDCAESYSLLLLDEPERIIRDIEVDPSGPVGALIRNIQPTISIQAMANQNNLSLKQMISLVYSLVYWRRARIIIPISSRHVYVVSPLAILNNLQRLSVYYTDLFPAMPPLQRFLATLSSTKPQPFAYFIPSRDHRDIYLRVLMWLLQNNLVVQLQTYVAIMVTRKIQLTVHYEADYLGEPEHAATQNNTGTEDPRKTDTSVDNSAKRNITNEFPKKALPRLEEATDESDHDNFRDCVIDNPLQATLVQKKWLNKIAASKSREMGAMFHRLSKYFNGKDCLEQVQLHENLSKQELRKFLDDFSEYLITYRHW
ncbi:Nitrogen permease regulator 3 [Wickerhamiella sorbophila]|uniref:Nitrogen permease regulator 3 n=1 Tax=Wickerhamiella sorbophila TaxID=45607 RepID=A0A2T0FNS7_9ASCO|nr:Nitrogen permease regulator 3 [Wickerhamiella sorbophila]PRT56640.1 Nitrogen permease regulator 3 [Wickerhamiella sorbophila]